MERIRQLRNEKGLSQAKLAVMADMDPATLNRLERGTGNPNLKTLERVADVLGVEVADFFPKAQSLSPEPSFDDEQRAAWEATVVEGRRLRETGRAQMWKALSEWSASKRREEPYAARQKYLDEMGGLLQEVYDAGGALGWAYIQAALTQGGSDASVPSYLREESRAMDQFYGKLFELVESRGLGIHTGADATAAKPGAKVQAEVRSQRSHEVQEGQETA